MRVMAVKRVNSDELFSRLDAALAIGVSPRTFDKYFRDKEFESKAIRVGNRNAYRGSEINARIDNLIELNNFYLAKN